jgi:hypothetical protein
MEDSKNHHICRQAKIIFCYLMIFCQKRGFVWNVYVMHLIIDHNVYTP